MRTIRVELEAPVGQEGMAAMFGGGFKLRVSTEVILEDDADAHEAGERASRVVTAFTAGYSEASVE